MCQNLRPPSTPTQRRMSLTTQDHTDSCHIYSATFYFVSSIKAIQSRKEKENMIQLLICRKTISACSNQSARVLTSSAFQSPSSYLYHLMSPSSFLVRWHIVHESVMHVRNSRIREAFSRID